MKKEITFTQQEQKVVDTIKEFKADGIDYIFSSDMEYKGLGDMKQIRGTLASLVKKGAIYIDTKEGSLISLLID